MPSVGKVGTKCAVIARDHIELPRFCQRAGVADHAVTPKRDPGAALRRKGVGKHRPDDDRERRQAVFLRDQRLGQGARFGRRLPAYHDVPGPNEAGKVERWRSGLLARHQTAPVRIIELRFCEVSRTSAGRAISRR